MGIKKEKVFVTGHKNPDTDSICSALCYAELKSRLNPNTEYIAARAGHMNEETQYVLERFGVQPPVYVKDVRTQVRDIEIREVGGVSQWLSLRDAWTLMRENNVVTLPVTEDGKLIGLITVSDIANSNMDVHDSRVLATARTKYKNIVETLDAEVIIGDAEAFFDKGKVLIAAANPDFMENYIEEHDLVILGNRYESQLCAIEMKADCLVVCLGAPVSMTIQKLAQERGCTIISTPHDTYTVARLINQSMPVKHFMRQDHLITFRMDAFTDTIKETMSQKRYRDFPILDKEGNYIGMISRRNLLNMVPKKLILLDHNEKSQAVNGIENAEILEIIDHHRLGSLETISPVFFRNQPLGCTATIIYQMYRENGVEISQTIASLLCAAILSDTLMYRSPTCTDYDRRVAEELGTIAGIDVEQFAKDMFRAGSNLAAKEPKEIFYQDFKTFNINDLTIGVGQLNAMTKEELADIKERLLPYLKDAERTVKANMIFFMLTNILKESTELLYAGEGAKELIQSTFGVLPGEDSFELGGVISRKKQLMPALIASIQQ